MLKDIWSRFPHLSNDIRDQKRMTPMHISAQNGDKESLVFLLNVGMDIDAMDDENNTPLHYAVAGRFK
jgi:ankyrin repeat protein